MTASSTVVDSFTGPSSLRRWFSRLVPPAVALAHIITPPLSLTPGTRIGVCQIAAQIGVGGMGEVYQVTDTTLTRQVAIKVLPTGVAADADRLARFQREAEVLAALSHPNIAAIYGLDKTPDFTLRDGSIRDLGVRGHGFVHVAPGWLAFQQGTTVLAVAFDPANPA